MRLSILSVLVAIVAAELRNYRFLSPISGENSSPAKIAEKLQLDADSSTFTIALPHGLAQQYEHADALFGMASYGSKVTGQLYLPNSSYTNPNGCGDLTKDPRIRQGMILMLYRGGCSFVQKVYNAQQAGAIGAIVINVYGVCGVSPQCPSSGQDCRYCPYGTPAGSFCSCSLPYMSANDTALASLVTIPSFLIGKEDGASIIASMGQANFPLFASMAWDLPNDNDQVTLEMWIDSSDANAFELRTALQPYMQYFGNTVLFEPKYLIYDGVAAGCNLPQYNCFDQCINGGFYCCWDPDNQYYVGISGADVVMENLRQMCVFQVTNATQTVYKWWNYVALFSQNCNTGTTWTQTCSFQQMQSAGISTADVQQCITYSNSTVNQTQGDYTNLLLENALSLAEEMYIVSLPTVLVNDIPLRHQLSVSTVLNTVCNGFRPGTAPQVCNCLDQPLSNLANCVNPNNGNDSPTPSKMPGWAVGLTVFMVLGIIGTILFAIYWHRRTKREVQTMLDDYRALMDTGDSEQTELRPNAGGLSHSGGVGSRLQQLAATITTPPPPTASFSSNSGGNVHV